jgi:excisionase family DNA binding protein
MRDALESVLALAKNLPREELPRLLGDLAEISATANARLTILPVEAVHDELVDIEETARRLGVSKDYLYRHQGKFPFARRIGRKLLFSSLGLEKFLARRCG